MGLEHQPRASFDRMREAELKGTSMAGVDPSSPEMRAAIYNLKRIAAEFERALLSLPASRERSLALTKNEEASMWATKAVLMRQPDEPHRVPKEG